MNDWFNIKTKDKKDIDINHTSDYETNQNNLNDNKKIKIVAKDVRTKNRIRDKKIKQVIDELPKKNEYIHIVSNGSFDYFKIIPRIIELSKKQFDLYASTWTMNYENAEELIKLIESGVIKSCIMITGKYMESREPLVFETLKQGLYDNNCKLYAFKNHCKIIGMQSGQDYYVIEMSANFTSNTRTEQLTFTNNKKLYDFHLKWIREVSDDNKK
jgi:hypothetical protein